MTRRLIIPEVIQTSAMDCGPAALKAVFAGYRRYLSYGRLREACRTDVDGTSIDTIEDIAVRLGLDATQRMLPPDHLLLSSLALPAIVVVRLPDGNTHFVVLWRAHGPLLQVMDPARGRVWVSARRFLASLYLHEQPVPRSDWDDWARSPDFQHSLARRLRALRSRLAPGAWPDLAHLDAAVRLAQALIDNGKLTRGAPCDAFLEELRLDPTLIPRPYWTAFPLPDDPDQVLLRGCVLIHCAGLNPDFTPAAAQLPEDLRAALTEPPPNPWAPVWRELRASGLAFPALITLAMAVAAAGTVLEALLFRGLFDLARHLTLSGQRLAAMAAFIAFLAGLLLLEWPAESGLLRLGRHLEIRLRLRFLAKIPRLPDRYFQSRLVSDMAFRAHTIHALRQLPELAGQFLRLAFTLLFTVAGIAWFFPTAALPAALAAAAAVAVPLLAQPLLNERDLRYRELTASLSRFYLDALLGLTAIQAHRAESTLRSAQASQLRHWAEAGLRFQGALAWTSALQLAIALSLVIWLVFAQSLAAFEPAGVLLLIYWALSIPTLGAQLGAIAFHYPSLRNTLLRFLEPLGAPEHDIAAETPAPRSPAPVSVDINDVTVLAAGHVILDSVSLHLAPGEHVAIVGRSGAGKSSLVGLLLGWHKPARGAIHINGEPLTASALAALRRETAWIDPQVHLFNTSLLENLAYGAGPGASSRIGEAVEQAGLASVLQRLPDGLQTTLGEGGALVSGGEGQRVRMGRAMARQPVRLAILDEPARGLDRPNRRDFIARARRRFSPSTLLYITHDITDALLFPRVLVIDNARIIENGDPRALLDDPSSRFHALYHQEEHVRANLWSHPRWRRLRLEAGHLKEQPQ